MPPPNTISAARVNYVAAVIDHAAVIANVASTASQIATAQANLVATKAILDAAIYTVDTVVTQSKPSNNNLLVKVCSIKAPGLNTVLTAVHASNNRTNI